MADFGNLFIDLLMWGIKLVVDIWQFLALLILVYLVANFVLKLLKPETFRKVNEQTYRRWINVCRSHKDNAMVNLHIAGTKQMSTRLLGKIYGFNEVYLEEPKKDRYSNTKDGKKQYANALRDYAVEKRLGLDHCYLFLVRAWWKAWDKYRIYMLPTKFIVDDVLVGDILVNCAGYIPVLGTWFIPSNVNRMRYTDAIKSNSVYTAYEEDWEYMGNIASRAIEADNEFLKAKGIKESILEVFKPKEQKQK